MNRQELIDLIYSRRSFLCVGLDVDKNKMPAHLKDEPDGVFLFNKAIIDATIDYAVAYKPNLAFYEAMGIEGLVQLKKTMDYLHSLSKPAFTIADAKRGDIGNTSQQYAKAFLDPAGDFNFDSLAVAPYMGADSVQPFTVFSMDFQAGAIDDADGRATIDRLNRGIAKLDDVSRQAVVLDYTSRKLYRYDLSDYMHAYGLVALLVVLLIAAVVVIAVQRVRAIHADQEEKVRMLVDHDPLTGAYSMNGFRKKAEELLRLHPDETHIIGYINFKSFKYINDSLGRKAGDDLLRFYVAKASEFLAEDEAIGRLEADHFAVLTRLDGDERLLSDEENVLDPTRNYFIDRGKETRVQICGGVYVLVPEDYRNIDIDHMLDLARVAEKRVRDTRKDGCEFYNPEQWEKGKRVADVVSHLPLAIKNGELRVWYQPQVNYVTGDVTGAEALCRWEHGKLGWIRPSEFIPVLEETGLIYDLDCFIWEEVCKDLARWNEQGMRQSVSVNLSRCDIRDGGDIAGHFSRLMREHGLTPDQLRVEVTETAFVEDPGLLISTTEKLRELGIVVEMDDFGSGYSSLHMLKEVPVDRIKLDMHFLTSSGDLEKGRIIVSDMIGLVGRLGMEMIAEGVETKGQADFLREHGCSEMQGYYFFKPMPVESFEKLGKTIECA
jgi:EAL domain-containing protein (putative c-di-GMP-specific phosphodiesterase class I)/GGDEF domain-containing protein